MVRMYLFGVGLKHVYMQCDEFYYLDQCISVLRLTVSSADIQFSTSSCAEETEVNKPDVSRNIYYSISINSCNILYLTQNCRLFDGD